MLKPEPRLSAAPPQSPQHFVYTVRAHARARAGVTPITTDCGDCGGSQALRVLERAAAVVGKRRSTYGPPIELFEQVATRWSLVIGLKVTPTQAMLCPAELKLPRIIHNPWHLDSIIDIARYAGCLAEALGDA